MIGSLTGVVSWKSPPQLLLEVAGVGYELEAPMSTFDSLPGLGERARLLTHLVVREDAHVLYGFASEAERSLFRALLKVSGVGPRIALAILSSMPGAAFAQSVHERDVAALTRVPGVGRKTAERLIVELRDRLADWSPALPGSGVSGAVGAEAEAHAALVALGYKPHEAARLLKPVGEELPGASTEDLIRRALQGAARE